jgi:hypothetical protein
MVRMGSKVVIAEFKQNGDIDFLATGSFRELLGNRRYGRKTLGAAWLHQRPTVKIFQLQHANLPSQGVERC